MFEKIKIWSIDGRMFVCKEIGRRHTPNIYDAAEFDTLDEAQGYIDRNIPGESVVFLKVLDVMA